MRNSFLCICISIILANSVSASERPPDDIDIRKYGEETRAKLKSMEKYAKNLQVNIYDKITPKELSTICKDAPWITKLHYKFGNETKSLKPIEDLKGLKNLSLFSGRLSGNEPLDLTPIKGLSNLNELTLIIPSSDEFKNMSVIENLKNLKKLVLSGVNCDSLDFLKGTQNIENLYISGRNSTFKSYKPILELKKLKELRLEARPQTNDEYLSVLSGLTSLENFHTDSNDITHLNFLKNCKNLSMVIAQGKNLKDLSGLKNNKKLGYLDISETAVEDISPLGELKNLSVLKLKRSKVKDIGALAECSKLDNLDLCETEITDLSPLHKLKNSFKGFIFLSKKNLSEKEIEALKKALHYCNNIHVK